MTQRVSNHERYVSDFQAFEKRAATNGPAWIRAKRQHALERFSELGFPTARKGNEKWKYTNVGPIDKATFKYLAEPGPNGVTAAEIRAIVPWHDGWVNLVFVDGRYSEALSTGTAGANVVRVTGLAEAMESNSDVVEQHLARYASVEDDGFTALNTAFVHDGAFVQLSEGEVMETPLHLAFVSTGQDGSTVSYPRVLVVAGPESRITLIESYVSLSQTLHFTNAVAEMVLGDGAEIDHHRLLLEGDNTYHVSVARVHQGEGATFSSKSFAKGPAIGRYDLYVLLDGPGASCHLNGLYVTSGNQHMDNFINIDHAKPHCTSRLYYKGILDGKSRAVFGGTVWVRKDAQKTDSLQTDKNLVLSPHAEVDSKPALFIYADDVKCGHGATAGNIDQETIFYMRSRGVDLETASRLLIRGFAGEMVETVELEPFKSYLEKRFLESLPSYKFEF